MISTKLIIIEGLPGSGKSTIGQFIGLQLQRNNINVNWHGEGDLDHPTDFEYEAGFTEEEYLNFLDKYESYTTFLQTVVVKRSNKYFLKYLDINRKHKRVLKDEIYKEISRYDVYESIPERYMEFALERWEEFVAGVMQSDTITVLDSSLFQIPINQLMLNNINSNVIIDYICKLQSIIEPLNPVIIYFYQCNFEQAIKRACTVKGEGWTNRVAKYIAETKYGKTRDLQGFDGMVIYFQSRKDIELELFMASKFNKLAIDNSVGDWDSYRKEILDFLCLTYKEDTILPQNILECIQGRYCNEECKAEFQFIIENGILMEGHGYMLIPKDNFTFYLEGTSTELTFFSDTSGIFDKMVIGGKSSGFMYEVGTVFIKMMNKQKDEGVAK